LQPVVVAFIASLVVVVLGAAILSFEVWPAGWPSNKTPSDQWAALAAIYGAGGFLLAVFATLIATIAYSNSTEKPVLVLAFVRYQGGGSTPNVNLVESPSLPYGEIPDWTLRIIVRNDGLVAARFLAMRVTLDGAGFFPGGRSIEPWRAGTETGTPVVWWEGGADAVVHPNWEYRVLPLVCPVRPNTPSERFSFQIEFVADDFPPQSTEYVVRWPQS